MLSHSYLLYLIMLGILLINGSCSADNQRLYDSFDDYPVYSKNDLWPEFAQNKTVLRLWAPLAEEVRVNIYERGHGSNLVETHSMKPDKKGSWKIVLKGNYRGKYYTFQTKYNGVFEDETPGIYAIAAGVNGMRAMILDLDETNPEGWNNDLRPKIDRHNDIILYELHVRDITSHPNAGSSYPGKYLGLVEEGTRNTEGQSTGIDHMKELGITHVHLLPVFDYRMVDETRLNKSQFNWGYDPENYNIPEGSYSSNPYNAEIRIKEFKQMIQGFHKNGIRVIMDVVFNHTARTENSNFNLEVPGYYYRTTEQGEWSDASGCGNETASERAMMRKFIIESCKFWVKEYHVDGFRFDLMGIHDIETLNLLSAELKKIDPSIFVYGEGWTASSSPLPDSLRALKENTVKLTDIAAFSDDIRDGIKGNVFDIKSTGFVNGAENMEESVKFGVVASTNHPQIDFEKSSSKSPWANQPAQTIGYVSCHDNNTLYDKLSMSRPDLPASDIIKMQKLSNAIVLTSQSIPFLHAGAEFLRTKGGEHNSFNKPDEINQIDWSWKTKNSDVFEYYKSLISLRKAHPAFRMSTTDQIANHLRFFDIDSSNVVAYQINDHANGDSWKSIIVVYNARAHDFNLNLPPGIWSIAAKGQWVRLEEIETAEGMVLVPSLSMMILFQN
jgi:pullulanase